VFELRFATSEFRTEVIGASSLSVNRTRSRRRQTLNCDHAVVRLRHSVARSSSVFTCILRIYPARCSIVTSLFPFIELTSQCLVSWSAQAAFSRVGWSCCATHFNQTLPIKSLFPQAYGLHYTMRSASFSREKTKSISLIFFRFSCNLRSRKYWFATKKCIQSKSDWSIHIWPYIGLRLWLFPMQLCSSGLETNERRTVRIVLWLFDRVCWVWFSLRFRCVCVCVCVCVYINTLRAHSVYSARLWQTTSSYSAVTQLWI